KRAWLVDKLKQEARAGKAARAAEVVGPLEGAWQAVAYEANGRSAPEAVVKGMRLEFRGDRMSVYRQGERVGAHQLRLQPPKRPAVMLLKTTEGAGTGRTFSAIYELDGDRLRLCLNQQEGGRPPVAFRTGHQQPGSGTDLIELRRVKGP